MEQRGGEKKMSEDKQVAPPPKISVRMDYVMKQVELTSSNIGSITDDYNEASVDGYFVENSTIRKIRTSKVDQLYRNILKKEHFDSIFVVNLTKNEKGKEVRRLLDGHHRFKAIKKAFLYCQKHNIEMKMDIWFAEYKNLTDEEEKDIFNQWNIGTKQTSDDFIRIWFNTVPLGEKMLKEIPASIYSEKTKLKLKIIAGEHLDAKRQLPYSGGFQKNGLGLISDLQSLTPKDIQTMKQFRIFLEELFDRPYNTDYLFNKNVCVKVLYRIWFDNLQLGDTLKKALLKVFFGPHRVRYEEFSIAGGRETAMVYYRDICLDLLSLKERKGFKYVTFVVAYKDNQEYGKLGKLDILSESEEIESED
jgi:hypothetical protein